MKEDIIELGTGLPLYKVVLLDDENPSIQVDWYFIRMVLARLRILQRVAPDEIAEANLPDTLEYAEELYKLIK